MKYTVGSTVVTQFTGYKHFSLVSDRVCADGKPMLISATKRSKTVKEETWDTVTNGKETWAIRECSTRNEALNAIKRARSQIGEWEYSPLLKNCEHFVNWAVTGQLSSKQVSNGLLGAGAGIVGVALLSEKPQAGMIILGGLVCAVAAVALTNSKA